jgi:hypothetical protein
MFPMSVNYVSFSFFGSLPGGPAELTKNLVSSVGFFCRKKNWIPRKFLDLRGGSRWGVEKKLYHRLGIQNTKTHLAVVFDLRKKRLGKNVLSPKFFLKAHVFSFGYFFLRVFGYFLQKRPWQRRFPRSERMASIFRA